MTLTAFLYDIDPVTGYVWGTEPPAVTLAPKFIRRSVHGGSISAEVEVTGAKSALWDVLNWLRRPIDIQDESGQVVWGGFINEVRVTNGSGLTVGVSLDGMANKIAVAYAFETATGGYERGTTSYAMDTASASRYGVKELLLSLGKGGATEALAKRAALLSDTGVTKPRNVPTFDGQRKVGATLVCVGWRDTLKWRRFGRADSRVEFVGDDSADSQPIGWGLTSTRIGFTQSPPAVHDLDARLAALKVGNKVSVSGSGSNNRVVTISQTAKGGYRAYTASTIYFEPSDDIKDSARGLGFLRSGALMKIAGSSNNSKVHEVGDTGDDAITAVGAYNGLITPEAVGPSITIEQGNEVYVANTMINEVPASMVTLTLHGYRMAQSFSLGAGITLGRIGLMLNKVGSPTDVLTIQVCANNSGAPGAALASANVSPGDLATSPSWTWLSFSNTNLGPGTYFITISRSGALNATNYYEVGQTSTAYGSCVAYTGSTWITNPTGSYIPIKVHGVQETTAQISRIIADVGQHIRAVDIKSASAIYTNPDQSGDDSALDVIEKLLELGTSSGQRLFYEVTADRVLRVYGESANTMDIVMLNNENRLIDTGGNVVPRGVLPINRWLIVQDVPSHLGLFPALIDEAEYDIERDAVRVTPKMENAFV